MSEMRRLYLLLFYVGLYQRASGGSECTDRGRYPNNDDSDCRGYTICLIGGNGTFTQYRLTCPNGFIYSHNDRQCTNVTGYYCLSSHNCTNPGKFINPDRDDCTSYIACPDGINELVSARLVQCPMDKVYSPAYKDCVNQTEYKCSIRRINVAAVIELEGDLANYYESFNFNGVAKVHLKNTVVLCMIASLFVLQ